MQLLDAYVCQYCDCILTVKINFYCVPSFYDAL